MLQKILACATFVPMLLACAPFAQADMRSMSPGQLTLVDNVCTSAMGLRTGEYYFALCRESLAQTLAAKSEGQDMAADFRDCRQRGLQVGTVALATCMLDDPAQAAPAQPVTVASLSAGDAATSFYHMPARVRIRQERYACAELGLRPGSGGFSKCFADLNAAMTSNPN